MDPAAAPRSTASLSVEPGQAQGDRGRTGVEAPGHEIDPQGGDPGHGPPRSAPCGLVCGPARARLKAVEPLLVVPAKEPVEVPPAEVALRCGGSDGQLP